MTTENKHDDICEYCEVGMFRLPGIIFRKDYEISEERLAEMDQWAKEHNCGYRMTDRLWSFKTTATRDWFLFRWSAELNIK